MEHTDFDADNIHFEGHLEWVGPEIETFLCPEMATSKAGAIWDPDSHQSEPDPHQSYADQKHCLQQGFQNNYMKNGDDYVIMCQLLSDTLTHGVPA